MSYYDLFTPASDDVIGTAIRWFEKVLLGTFATTIAVIAIAAIGLLMLTGRIDLRRGATVIVGCFIVFGASTIVIGLQATVTGTGPSVAWVPPPALPSIAQITPVTPPPAVPAVSDPYAGAAVPKNH